MSRGPSWPPQYGHLVEAFVVARHDAAPLRLRPISSGTGNGLHLDVGQRHVQREATVFRDFEFTR